MKVKVTRERFLTALNAVKDGTTNEGAAVLSFIKLETVGEDHLILTATSLDITVRTKIPCTVMSQGSCAVQARTIIPMVAALSAGVVELEGGESGSNATLTGGEVEYKLGITDVRNFPQLRKVEGAVFKIPLNDFTSLLRHVSYAAADNTGIRRSMMGVYITTGAEGIVVCATDGKRFAKYAHAMEGLAEQKVIVPSKAVTLFQRLRGEGNAEVTLSDGAVKVSIEDCEVISKIITEPYPPVERIIPTSSELEVNIEREALKVALRQVGVASNDGVTKLTIKNNTLYLNVKGTDETRASAVIPVKSDKEIEIWVNCTLMLQAIDVLEEDELKFSFTDGNHPILIETSSGAIAVISVLRVNK